MKAKFKLPSRILYSWSTAVSNLKSSSAYLLFESMFMFPQDKPEYKNYLQDSTGTDTKGETENDVKATELNITVLNLWVPGYQGGIQNLTQMLRLLLQHTAKVTDLTMESKLSL